MNKPLVIFGTAEMAELARFYFEHDSDHSVAAFTVDDGYVQEDSFNGLPVIPFSEVVTRYPPQDADMHVALSYTRLNQLRESKYQQARDAGYNLVSYICSRSVTWPDLRTGDNCFILENQTIQPGVIIGNNVMLWSGNHIGHGSSIGDHTYLSSHVVVSGHCRIGKRCFLGVNATLKDFSTVGDDCFITMDCSIVKDVPSGAVTLGSPATILAADDRTARKIKSAYFRL